MSLWCPLFRLLVGIILLTSITVEANGEWFPFAPKPDPFTNGAIDLRFLNENFAGEYGFIGVRNGRFVHTGNQVGLLALRASKEYISGCQNGGNRCML